MATKELQNGSPLKHPNHDCLGRYEFAKSLAKSIINIETKTEQGFVYCLDGCWGSGKSTIINFVEHYINEHNSKKENEIIIFRFNPWMFSCANGLVAAFLSQLRLRLGMKGVPDHLKTFAKNLGFIEATLKLASPVTKFIPVVNEITNTSKEILSDVKDGANQLANLLEKDLHHIKEDIIKALQKQENKILVIIDDVDRLLDDDLKSLMKMIKAICDFPQMIYLISCDSEKVAHSLGGDNKDGHNYLQKIVQCTWEVPSLRKGKLPNLFNERFAEILQLPDDNNPLFDRDELKELLDYAVFPCLKTPRDINILANSIKAPYASVKDEVNIHDFIGLQAIRTFYPNAYRVIKDNSKFFINYYSPKGLKDFHEDNLKQTVSTKELENFKKLMGCLFPKYKYKDIDKEHTNNIFTESSFTQRNERKTHNGLISHAKYFPIYFTLSINEDEYDFSASQVKKILDLAYEDDKSQLENKLRDLIESDKKDSTEKYKAFLYRLTYYDIQEIPREHIQNILQVIYDLSDEIIGKPIDLEWLFSNLSYELIKSFTEQESRFQILEIIFERSKSVSMVVIQAADLFQEVFLNQAAITVTKEQATYLINIWLRKIKEFANNRKLSHLPLFRQTIWYWREFELREEFKPQAGEKDIKQYIREIAETDQGLIDCLISFSEYLFKRYEFHCLNKYEYIEKEDIERLGERASKIMESNDADLLKDGRTKEVLEAFINYALGSFPG